MPESVKVALYIAALCSIICTVGACLFFKGAKQNDCDCFGTLDTQPSPQEQANAQYKVNVVVRDDEDAVFDLGF